MKIRAYNASGKFYTESGSTISIGLLTCDVTGLPEGSEVISYKWYHDCTQPMCEIQEGTPYYRAVDDTLLVDVTSHDMRGRYYCEADYGNKQRRRPSTSTVINVAGSLAI